MLKRKSVGLRCWKRWFEDDSNSKIMPKNQENKRYGWKKKGKRKEEEKKQFKSV